jgi:hypothetical protein
MAVADECVAGGLILAIAYCVGRGAVRTTHTGISKESLWGLRRFQWDKIAEIRLYEKHRGAIELRSDGRRILIDALRLNAYEHLLGEIQNRTGRKRSEWHIAPPR